MLLAKRGAQAVSKARQGPSELRSESATERVYVPLEHEIPHEGNGEPRAVQTVTEERSKPSMQEVFGPGGLLERCMIGGYEHRRAQLEMAEAVQDAFEGRHHVVGGAGNGAGGEPGGFFAGNFRGRGGGGFWGGEGH